MVEFTPLDPRAADELDRLPLPAENLDEPKSMRLCGSGVSQCDTNVHDERDALEYEEQTIDIFLAQPDQVFTGNDMRPGRVIMHTGHISGLWCGFLL